MASLIRDYSGSRLDMVVDDVDQGSGISYP